MNKKKESIKALEVGASQIVPKVELEQKLSSGKKLKIKFGMDPTAPDLHLGHAVVLNKLKQFQELGHEIIVLIGDFTARIGDPTEKSKTRPSLSDEEIKHNTKTYFDQVSRILDRKKIVVKYNSEWLSKLTCKDIVSLCAKVTVARLVERDDFQKRLKNKVAIGMHELLYPIFQGYDSVELKADVELGGTDQTFNLLFGRYLQERYGQTPQVILTVPILEGLDGTEKMSKSLGNAIGLTEAPAQVYGKLMSISDKLMWRYYLLLLDKSEKDIEEMQQGQVHPMKLKKQMAYDIIARYWSEKDANQAQDEFEKTFQKKDYSKVQEVELSKDLPNSIWIPQLLQELKAVTSSSQAKRLIESGAVSIDDKKVLSFKDYLSWTSGMIVKVGKHKFYKLT